MIQLQITQTGKGYNEPADEYRIYNEETKTVADMQAAEEYLRERYGNCKRSAMFRDTKTGETKRVGRIYHYRDADWSHSPVEKWLAQDWIAFYELSELIV